MIMDETEYDLALENEFKQYSSEVRGYARAVSVFSRLSYALWGGFFVGAVNAYEIADWFYLTTATVLLAVFSMYWAYYLKHVLLYDAIGKLERVEYDIAYHAWGGRSGEDGRETVK